MRCGAWVKQARFARQQPSSRRSRTGLPRRFATPIAPRHVAALGRGSAPWRRSRATRRPLHSAAAPRSRPRSYAVSSPPPTWLAHPSSSPSAWRRRTRLFQCGGPRPGERRGTSVASPIVARLRAMLAGSVTMASSFMRPWHLGQARTSTANVRARSSAHARYPPARLGVSGSSVAAAPRGAASARCAISTGSPARARPRISRCGTACRKSAKPRSPPAACT